MHATKWLSYTNPPNWPWGYQCKQGGSRLRVGAYYVHTCPVTNLHARSRLLLHSLVLGGTSRTRRVRRGNLLRKRSRCRSLVQQGCALVARSVSSGKVGHLEGGGRRGIELSLRLEQLIPFRVCPANFACSPFAYPSTIAGFACAAGLR